MGVLIKRKRKALIPKPKLLKKAEKVFNAYIRKRDAGLGCISCSSGEFETAGHYFPVGAHSALRYNEWNVNGQCISCNKWRHGNLAHYRIGLVQKIGEKAVNEIETIARVARVKKWDREELEEIITKYKI